MITVNIQTEPFTSYNITRVRGDTKKINLTIVDGPEGGQQTPVDLTLWSDFFLTVDPSRAPANALNNVEQMTGNVEVATDGTVSFTPAFDTAAGSYWFDIQATDEDGGIRTLVMGKYTLIQDITKD